ncbi:hypothetical protein [Thiocapsa marina]|uniref:ATP-binding protein n=1 Tax=Thiocapsa marina 5811 TaxID=768671 RepID=F9UAN7_9GAMM|nr:hypothetical protein [Thiocapsa marina]EGV18789.1 hypothetical protein ThimaDRAFT_2207 [Thiocapsa marina 5811]
MNESIFDSDSPFGRPLEGLSDDGSDRDVRQDEAESFGAFDGIEPDIETGDIPDDAPSSMDEIWIPNIDFGNGQKVTETAVITTTIETDKVETPDGPQYSQPTALVPVMEKPHSAIDDAGKDYEAPYDAQSGTTPIDTQVSRLPQAISRVAKSVELAVDDIGAPYDVMDAWRIIRNESPRDYAQFRAKIKAVKGFQIGPFEKELGTQKSTSAEHDLSAEAIIDMIRKESELFHDKNTDTYIATVIDGYRQTWKLGSTDFRTWLIGEIFDRFERCVPEATISQVITTLKAYALRRGTQKVVGTRVLCLVPEKRYLVNLGDAACTSIEVSAEGYKPVVLDDVHLLRSGRMMRALPFPAASSSLDALWEAVNVPEKYRLIVIAWMIQSFRVDSACPVIEFVGEEGSGKTMTTTCIRNSVDPKEGGLTPCPRSIQDLYSIAANSHVICLENVSWLSPETQDALCTIVTGGGYAGRQLYTNADEFLLPVKNPVIINGISAAITASDLADRSISIICPRLQKRRTESDVMRDFAQNHAAIFGALLSEFVAVLKVEPQIIIDPEKLPRMGNYAYTGEAVYQANGRAAGEFLEDFNSLRVDVAARAVESHAVGNAILAFLKAHPEGLVYSPGNPVNIKSLLCALRKFRSSDDANWPTSARAFADAIRRLSPSLARIGIEARIGMQRTNAGYPATLRYLDDSAPIEPEVL